ncbi:tRNA modification GTPase gtpbp3, mitochondrial [Kickxella alabastrina]|nr:tRNA modification GTPase gtpbp3, mitochondrial [Kickxella alabastrina]
MLPHPPRPRQAQLTRIHHPTDRTNTLDRGLCLFFPSPNSYTGEDMAELHVHGGTAVVGAILQALGSLPGMRLAEAGEFSRRAFDSGKMDLTEIEGVADLVNAQTEEQRRMAVRQAGGELHRMYDRWRTQLVGARAQMEAFIDFSEDENIEDGVVPQARAGVQVLGAAVRRHLDDRRRGELLRDGVELCIVGPPNAGKSSLLNRLALRQVAIVSEVAGTTRDIVEATLDIGGFPVVIRDSAGLRETTGDAVEAEGIRRAVEAARRADVRVVVLDAEQAMRARSIADAVSHPAWLELIAMPHTFVVLNKVDRPAVRGWAPPPGFSPGLRPALVSCVTMEGWDALMRGVAADIRGTWGSHSSAAASMPLTKARHREHLVRCMGHVDAFERCEDVVLAAEELRHAADALGRITGRVGIEDVLDALFTQFCIGK